MKRISWKVAVAFACVSGLGGCNLNRGDDVQDTPAPTPPPTPPPAATTAAAAMNDVVRYSGMEQPDQGTLTVRNAVRARRAADFTSELVDTLPAGAEVDRVAKYGAFTLVSWQGDSGLHQGWIDALQATRTFLVVPTATATATASTTPTVATKPTASPVILLKPKGPAPKPTTKAVTPKPKK
jgi:hypothetical protein